MSSADEARGAQSPTDMAKQAQLHAEGIWAELPLSGQLRLMQEGLTLDPIILALRELVCLAAAQELLRAELREAKAVAEIERRKASDWLEACTQTDIQLQTAVRALEGGGADALYAEEREVQVQLTGIGEIGWAMTHPNGEFCTELGRAVAKLVRAKDTAEAALASLTDTPEDRDAHP